jgi:L-arabinokinase
MQGRADVDISTTLLRALGQPPSAAARLLFDPDGEVFITRAPGRLDVMGGIADYSGSLVLELPLAEATLVALQRDPNRTISVVSLGGVAR